MKEFEGYSDEAKVWVYQADRPLTVTEQNEILGLATEFVAKWSTHGTALKAKAAIIPPFHLILSVDGDVQASGCSIDSSVRFVKSLGQNLQIDFFNRLKSVIVQPNNGAQIISYHDLKDHLSAKVYHPTITNMKELRNNWLVPVKEMI